jgi:hypothetical protein
MNGLGADRNSCLDQEVDVEERVTIVPINATNISGFIGIKNMARS